MPLTASVIKNRSNARFLALPQDISASRPKTPYIINGKGSPVSEMDNGRNA